MAEPLSWPIEAVEDSATLIQAVSTQVLAANSRRADAVFVNDSNQPIYLARGNAAVLNAGIRLNANGGSYEINRNNLFLGVINAIAVGGDKNLVWSEGYQ